MNTLKSYCQPTLNLKVRKVDDNSDGNCFRVAVIQISHCAESHTPSNMNSEQEQAYNTARMPYLIRMHNISKYDNSLAVFNCKLGDR